MAISYQYYEEALKNPEDTMSVRINSHDEEDFLANGLEGFSNLENLFLDCRHFESVEIKFIEDSLKRCKKLKKLTLEGNAKFKHLPNSLKELTLLKELVISNYDNLTILSPLEGLENLKILTLYSFKNLTTITDTIGELRKLKSLTISTSPKLAYLPNTIGNLANLEELELLFLYALDQLPDSIGKLDQLRKLRIERCELLKTFPKTIENLKNLTTAKLDIKVVPESIKGWENLKEFTHIGSGISHKGAQLTPSLYELKNLQKLTLKENAKLIDFPEALGNLQNLELLEIDGCNNFTTLPEALCKLKNLTNFTISGKKFNHLPENIGELPHLKTLKIFSAKLDNLPSSLSTAKSLVHLDLKDVPISYIPLGILTKKDLTLVYEHPYKDFLEGVRKCDFSESSYHLALDLLTRKANIFEELPIEDFYKLLQFPYRPLYDLACLQLLNRLTYPFSQEAATQMHLCILGGLKHSKIDEVAAQLTQLGLKVFKKLSDKVTHVVVGYTPGKEFEKVLAKKLTIILPDQINKLLQSKQEKSFLEELDGEMEANFKKLLFSKDENNQLIALQMLKQGKIPKNLHYLLLLVRIFGHKYLTKVSRKEFDRLVALQFPTTWKTYFSKKDGYVAAITSLAAALKDSTIDKEQLFKIGFEFFRRQKHSYIEIVMLAFSNNCPSAEVDRILIKNNQSLDLRELAYVVDVHDFKNFDAKKYTAIEELWISSMRRGIPSRYLAAIEALSHVKTLKIHGYPKEEGEEGIKKATERFQKKFPAKEIILLKY